MAVPVFDDLDLSKSYTYADYLNWHFEERTELIKAKIFRLPSAHSSVHQLIAGAISGELYIYLKGKIGKVFLAPFDVRLFRFTEDKHITTVVQPDVCVICDPAKIDARGCLGAPDILIEVLSLGNNNKELQNKYEVYEEAGVLEYWIIHPSERTFFKYALVEGRFQASKLLTIGDEVTTPLLPSFALSLTEVLVTKILLKNKIVLL